MKKVTIVIPTYNEEENIENLYNRVTSVLKNELLKFEYEIMFVDNNSNDSSRELICNLCAHDCRVKAIFNARNFGFSRSIFYGLTQATGDCAVLMFADMQDPPEIIPQFLKEWNCGYKIVIGIKAKSKENPILYFMRNCYYKLLKKICEIDHIEQFDGFGLYDRSFLDVLCNLDDPIPYLRGIVAELGYKRKNITYVQEIRKKGKSKFNFFKLYDLAMLGVTSYSKIAMRLASFIGLIVASISFVVALVTFIMKLILWDSFPVGIAAISIGVFFLGAVQLFFIGFLGEYILNINTRTMHRPLVIEEQRINFQQKKEAITQNEL